MFFVMIMLYLQYNFEDVHIMKEILREIGAISRCFESIADIEFKDYNLGKNQYIYVTRIAENPGIILEHLSDMIKVDRSTASRVVKELEKNDFIRKIDRNGTGKKIELYVTNKGTLAYSMLKNDEEYSNYMALKGFNKDDVELLLYFLMKIRTNIEPDWKRVKKGLERPYEKLKWMNMGQKRQENLNILNYQAAHFELYKKISYEWLDKYDLIEPEDIKMLEHPQEEIIDKGGCIFMAELRGEIVGTVSLIKYDMVTFELAKLGVKEAAQNKGIAKKLIVTALLNAHEKGAHKVILYTTKRLKAACALYESFGFKIVDEQNDKYQEAEITMELCFR